LGPCVGKRKSSGISWTKRGDDFEDPHELAKFAATVGIPLEEFRQQFEYLIEYEPPPLMMDAAGEASRTSAGGCVD
jgi:hypothetical protein